MAHSSGAELVSVSSAANREARESFLEGLPPERRPGRGQEGGKYISETRKNWVFSLFCVRHSPKETALPKSPFSDAPSACTQDYFKGTSLSVLINIR